MEIDLSQDLPKPFFSLKTSIKGCLLLREHRDWCSWFTHHPVLSSTCQCLLEYVVEKRSCYFCLEQKNKPEKRTARHWAKGSVSGSPVCMYMYIYDYIYAYMCVCMCIYTENGSEYLCIGSMNLSGAKSLLKEN